MEEQLVGVRALIVEDRPAISELLAIALEGEGMIPVVTVHAESALAEARKQPPAIVLLDLLLPGPAGDSLITALRALPGCATVPVIVLSGAESGLVRSKAAGAQDFLAKPFDLRELVVRIRRLLSQARA